MERYYISMMMRKRLDSFKYAINGLLLTWRGEANFRIHSMAALAAIALGLYLDITWAKWLWIIFAIGLVFFAELVNTAIEHICDRITSESDDQIRKVKDISAAAVFVAALTALVVGVIIFLPLLMERV